MTKAMALLLSDCQSGLSYCIIGVALPDSYPMMLFSPSSVRLSLSLSLSLRLGQDPT